MKTIYREKHGIIIREHVSVPEDNTLEVAEASLENTEEILEEKEPDCGCPDA